MKEKRNNCEETLCHRCRYGGEVMECCHCPELPPDPWAFFEPTDERRGVYQAAQFIVRQNMGLNKLPPDFSLLPYVAVAAAVANNKCEYYAE